jgi:2-polyprenyl-6-methoxyphenol hydroxylase-like FAD-dependent oxidoreductase
VGRPLRHMKNERILISGAGIAGPTLAYWLLRYGFTPTLVERAPAPRTGGYIIDFWGRGYDVAERMGLTPALRAEGYAIDEVRIVDADGRRVGGFPVRAFEKTLKGRYISILRSSLARLLYGAIRERVRTIFDDSVTALHEDMDGVHVTFAHAATERFDLVVGADGLHSAVRRLAFGPQQLFETYLGYEVAAFSVAGYAPRDEHVYVGYALPGRQLYRCALREDRTVFFFVLADERATLGGHDQAEQQAILRAAFGDAGWECRAILAAMEHTDDFYFDAVSQIHMNAWSRGRTVLVGDACACPSLLAGQGAALAVTAAYVLAGELKKAGGDYTAAFSNYEALLRPFIAGKQRAGKGVVGAFAPKTRLGIFLRNQITRLMTLPPVATLTLGPLLADSLALPDYERP